MNRYIKKALLWIFYNAVPEPGLFYDSKKIISLYSYYKNKSCLFIFLLTGIKANIYYSMGSEKQRHSLEMLYIVLYLKMPLDDPASRITSESWFIMIL